MKHFQTESKMKFQFVIFFLVFQCNLMSAQIASISTMEICAGQEVFVPVSGYALSDIGALTFYIDFDTNNLTFLSVENIDLQLSGMSVNLMVNPKQLAFAWSNTVPISFINTKLFDIKFVSNGQSSVVHYNTGCELSDTGGVVIPVTFIDGAINSGLPIIISNPHDTTVFENGIANFITDAPNASSYLWRESKDNGVSWIALDDNEIFSGTHTRSLTISQIPIAFNNYFYQCVLYRGVCQINSNPARLTVDEFSGISVESIINSQNFSVSPVPFREFLTIKFMLEKQCNVKISSINIMGQLVANIELPSQSEGSHYIKINTVNWLSGLYFVRMEQIFPDCKLNSVIKVIRK
ncbi:MAG: T9SS type A sorting domain-containing protein [Bacteroidota bacterium]